MQSDRKPGADVNQAIVSIMAIWQRWNESYAVRTESKHGITLTSTQACYWFPVSGLKMF